MAERDYRSPQERAQTTALPQAVQGGSVAAQRPEQVRPNLASQALQGLLSIGGRVADQQFQQDVQAQYLEGQRARMSGMAFEEIDSNPLTRPFVRGGYQDQDYRMRQAAFVAEAEQYIRSEGREQTPVEFSRYIAERSQSVLDSIGGGLSTQGRAEALQSQTAAEASLIASQAKAYSDYSVQQAAARITTQGNQINADLTRTKGASPAEHTANVLRSMAYYQNILEGDDSIPQEMRPEIASNYVLSLLSSDNNQVVEAMRDQGMLDNLEFSTRVKIDGALRESKNRTSATDNLANIAYDSKFAQDMSAGRITDPMDVHAQASRMASNGASEAQIRSLYDSYFSSLSDSETKAEMYDALNRGDVSALTAMGVSPQDAITKANREMAQGGMPVPARMSALTRMGMQIGTVPKELGQNVDAALNVMASQEEMNPEQRDVLSSVINEVVEGTKTNPAAVGVVLDAMPERSKGVLSAMISAVDDGRDPYEVARQMYAQPALFAKLGEFQKGQVSAQFKTTLNEKVQDAFAPGLLDRTLKQFLLVTPKTSNPGVIGSIQSAVMQEAVRMAQNPDNVALFSGSDDANEAAVQAAISNVMSRSIVVGKPRGWTTDGVTESLLTLPRGTRAQDVFGTENTSVLGELLAERYPPSADGFTTTFKFDPATKQLWNQQLDESGLVVDRQKVDARSIGQEATRRREQVVAEARSARFGEEYRVGTPEGAVALNIDGINSAGISTRATLAWRKQLIKNEGLRLEAYKDTTGNTTVGVGANVQGEMKVGDRIDAATASRMFRERSDEALLIGERAARDTGVVNEQAKLALSSAAYQLGERGWSEFKRARKAIQDRDWEGFQNSIRNSLWFKQTPDRARQFMTNMYPHFTE